MNPKLISHGPLSSLSNLIGYCWFFLFYQKNKGIPHLSVPQKIQWGLNERRKGKCFEALSRKNSIRKDLISNSFLPLRWIYFSYIAALALFVPALFGPINLVVFHEDNSVLCFHHVKLLKIVSTSQSKKLIWLFSVFSYNLISPLGQLTIQTKYEISLQFL